MKILLLLLATMTTLTAKSQITIQTINLTVICCADSDSIDIGNNGQYDLKIKSMFEGIDSYDFNITPLQSNIQVQNNPIAFGNAFQIWWYNFGLISQTSIGCTWSTMYAPGTGYKYQGFKKVNAPNDTTFGWVKLNFVGNNSCNDTVYVLELGYSTIPNVHVYAGQTTISLVGETISANKFSVFPNPFTNWVNVNANNNEQLEIILYDITSRKLLQQIFTNSVSLNTVQLAKGIYIYEVRNKSGVIKKGKVVKD